MNAITTKQTGDAAEFAMAAELSFSGVPTQKMPDGWPGYDLVSEHPTLGTQCISVKARSKTNGYADAIYRPTDKFDWLGYVLLPADGSRDRRYFLIPRAVADAKCVTWNVNGVIQRAVHPKHVPLLFARFENNFALAVTE